MNRYSVIRGNFPREFLLLQGKGCKWRRCTFCDYHEDASANPYETNRAVLERVTGEFGVLDIINSGSAMELDDSTISHIKQVVRERGIHTIWFEAHYVYRNQLERFAREFHPAKVKFRCGAETFDPALRTSWHKGIAPHVTPQDIARHFQGICLLCCTEGDSRERILTDIKTAQTHFEYFSINLFCTNSTSVRRDEELAKWFEKEVYPTLRGQSGVEVLLNNTDLGVG